MPPRKKNPRETRLASHKRARIATVVLLFLWIVALFAAKPLAQTLKTAGLNLEFILGMDELPS